MFGGCEGGEERSVARPAGGGGLAACDFKGVDKNTGCIRLQAVLLLAVVI